MEKSDYSTEFHVYGRLSDTVKQEWDRKKAIVDKNAGPGVPNVNGDNREKEVDIAQLVWEAYEGYKHPGMRREFVIVSGDRDMRPAVEITYGCDFPARVHIWAWDETVANVYGVLHRGEHPVTLYSLDDHLYLMRR